MGDDITTPADKTLSDVEVLQALTGLATSLSSVTLALAELGSSPAISAETKELVFQQIQESLSGLMEFKDATKRVKDRFVG